MDQEKKEKKINLLLEDLSSLEDYIHDLFAFSPLPICFISPLGVILEANPAFLKISGFSFGEVVGNPVEDLFENQEIEKVTQATLKEDVVAGREMKFFPKGGKDLICQVFTKTRRDEENRPVGYFLGLFDMTGMKKNERELRQTQSALLNILEDTEEAYRLAEGEKEKTHAIISNFSDGLIVLDKFHRLILVNPQAQELFGLSEKGLVGKHLDELIPEGRVGKVLELVAKKGFEAPFSREELELPGERTLEITSIIMEMGHGEIGHLIILHDVSREKIVERLKTEFVSIAAHQLRTPLSAIKWTLRMLIDGDLGKITDEQVDFLQKTYQSNERMIDLVNSLLNVTRIEEGRFLYRPVPTDLIEIVEAVIESLQEKIKRKKINFKFVKPTEKLPKLTADAEKLKLAIQNLIDNAVSYTLPGKKVEVIIKVVVKKKGDVMRIAIKDEGVGIPKNQQSRVFTKFFRGANVIRLETVGSGLGLFIAKNIIEAHGGKISFKSDQKKGTTFYFTLPIKKEVKRFLETF